MISRKSLLLGKIAATWDDSPIEPIAAETPAAWPYLLAFAGVVAWVIAQFV